MAAARTTGQNDIEPGELSMTRHGHGPDFGRRHPAFGIRPWRIHGDPQC
jgi:hypothetical protein